MDLDSFFVSVSCLMHPALKGKPVLVGGTSDRGVVAACSYEARKFGIHSAMPMKAARRLCPEAILIRGDYEQYSKYSDIVTDMVRESVPVYEKSSIDEFYMDLTGMDRFFGCYKWATELRHRIIRETGLPISFGMSQNKTVSKIATDEAKPNNQMQVDYGTEKNFLAPLSVSKIPMIGEKTYQLLRSMGVEKVHTLQDMPPELLQHVLGENGLVIWKKANGIDNSPVEPYNERKSISCEETFDSDSIDMVMIRALLVKMTEKLAYQLRSENKLTACVTVRIRYSNFDTHTMQCRLPHTSSDHILIKKVKELFDKLFQRRMLIRLTGVRFSHLVGGGYQINLFEDSEELINLYQAMDRLRRVYGAQAVMRAVGSTHSLRTFNPFNGISSGAHGNEPKEADAKEYLLVLNLPGYIRRQLIRIKQYFHQKFEHVQAIREQPYMVLLRCHMREDQEERLADAIRMTGIHHRPVNIQLKDFQFFNDQTLYIPVTDPVPLVRLMKSLQQQAGLPRSQSFFNWHPHISIAHGITPEKSDKAKALFEKMPYQASFISDQLTLLKRPSRHDGFLVSGEFEMGRAVVGC